MVVDIRPTTGFGLTFPHLGNFRKCSILTRLPVIRCGPESERLSNIKQDFTVVYVGLFGSFANAGEIKAVLLIRDVVLTATIGE